MYGDYVTSVWFTKVNESFSISRRAFRKYFYSITRDGVVIELCRLTLKYTEIYYLRDSIISLFRTAL